MALGCAVLSLALLLSTLPAALRWGQAQLDTGTLLCADTLRFHIRADSDSPADQTVKLAVRDAVLAYADAHCTAQDKPAALRWAAESLPALELTARAVLARRGIFSTVTVQLVEMYFDTTRYSTGILPAGRYQALRIDLGRNARHGKNWWCVLYPGAVPLCLRHLRPAGRKRSGVRGVCGAVQMRGVVAAGDGKPGGSGAGRNGLALSGAKQRRRGQKRYGTPPHCAAYAVVEGV